MTPLCSLWSVVDEQNAHTEDTELPSSLEFRKDSEEENRDNEKDEDTKDLEAVPSESTTVSTAVCPLFLIFYLSGLLPIHICLALMHYLWAISITPCLLDFQILHFPVCTALSIWLSKTCFGMLEACFEKIAM